jgi:putative transposase
MSDKQLWLPRKRPDHTPHPREECDIIFVTVCTHLRSPLLANHLVHETLRRLWFDSSHWIVGRYVLMPEHVHLFVVRAGKGTASVKKWISWWKRELTIQLNLGSGRWQEDFWDTRIRSEEHYVSRWMYVRNNPVRAGLVPNPDLWRYQGEIYILKV